MQFELPLRQKLPPKYEPGAAWSNWVNRDYVAETWDQFRLMNVGLTFVVLVALISIFSTVSDVLRWREQDAAWGHQYVTSKIKQYQEPRPDFVAHYNSNPWLRREGRIGPAGCYRSPRAARDCRSSGRAGADFAFFEAFPTGGAGTSGACSTTAPTGAKGEVLTFTRASNGTCTKTASGGLATTGIANGDLVVLSNNVARVEYDSAGTLGLRVEAARTNYALNSQDLTAATWTLQAATCALPTRTANQATAPDDALAADKFDFPACANTAGYTSVVYTNTALSCLISTCVASIYVRGVSGSGSVYMGATPDGVTYTGQTACAFNSTSWSRCILPLAGIGAAQYVVIGPDFRDPVQRAAGSVGATSVYLWQADYQPGTYITSPIPTAGATATRVAEVAYMTLPAAPNATGLYSLAVTASVTATATQNWTAVVQHTAGASPYRALFNDALGTAFRSDVFNASSVAATRAVLGSFSSKRFVGYNDGTNQYGIYDGTTFGPVAGTRTAPAATRVQLGNSFAAGFEIDGIVSRVCLDPDPARCR